MNQEPTLSEKQRSRAENEIFYFPKRYIDEIIMNTIFYQMNQKNKMNEMNKI